MARRHGSTGQVAIDPTGASTYVPIASLNAWTLDSTRDKVEVTAFGDTNKQYVVGLPDTKGTFAGWWDETTTPDQVFDVAGSATAVGLKLVPSTLTPTYFASGRAYLDASIDVKSDGAVAISGEWVAAGPWVWAPATTLVGRGGERAPAPEEHGGEAAERRGEPRERGGDQAA